MSSAFCDAWVNRPLPWLFVSERGQPMTRQAVNYLIGAIATDAGLPNVHPHTLRHSCVVARVEEQNAAMQRASPVAPMRRGGRRSRM
jgi:integrase